MNDITKARKDLAVGVVLSAACMAVFILTREPYAGVAYFALLAAKAVLLWMHECWRYKRPDGPVDCLIH